MRRIAIVLACLLACASVRAQVQPGDTPPDALGVMRGDDALTLSSLHGKVAVVTFWATWCGYCMKELPILAGLQQLAIERHMPLQIVAVNEGESRATFVQSARALHRKLPSLIMSWDRDGSIGKPYGADQGIPVMAMFHRDGTLAHLHTGYDESALPGIVAEINALMAESPAPPAARTAGAPADGLAAN